MRGVGGGPGSGGPWALETAMKNVIDILEGRSRLTYFWEGGGKFSLTFFFLVRERGSHHNPAFTYQ